MLAAAAVCFALASFGPVMLRIGLGLNVVVLMLFLADRRCLPRPGEVRIHRDHSRALTLDQPNKVRVEVANNSPHALRGILQDNPPDPFECEPATLGVRLPARMQQELVYVLRPVERGRFRFSEGVLRARGPMGLAVRDFRFGPAGDEVSFTVYPGVSAATPRQVAAFAQHMETGYHRLRRQVEGTTPAQIRDYTPGDSYRDIHWKATARHDRPMVTQFDADRNQSVYIFVDCGRLMRLPVGRLRKADHAVKACADLARVAIDRGDNVGLCCFSSRVKVWHDAKGRREQLLRILDSLALVTTDNLATNYHAPINMFLARTKRRSLCLFLTTFAESESCWQLMSRLLALRPRHIPAVVSLTDPALAAALKQEARSFEDACRKLAAADLREEVELFAQQLRHHRGYFLEVDADSLSLGVVQTYLDAKSRGLL